MAGFALLAFSACSSFNNGPGQNNLDDLAGEWVRVRSNNPANDGMVVTVTGSTGTVTENPRSSFTIGAVKWRNIMEGESDDFTYEELGSDGNYYDATMELEEDTIYIDVFSTGAGNTQKYVRREAYTDPGPSAETIILDCGNFDISAGLVNGPAAVDYIVPGGCVLDITDALTIQPGTVIEFEENAGIGVYDGGSINAVGTATEPIVMRGSEAVAGYWRGIHIETISFNNQFDYVNISDAGSNYVYCCNEIATVLLKGGKLKMTNSTLSNGDSHGLYANAAAELIDYANNTITTHEEFAMYLHMERANELDGRGSDYSGNPGEYVGIFSSTVDDEITIPALNVPYYLESGVTDFDEAVVIEAGAEFVMETGSGIGVNAGGSLAIEGTAAEPVIMRGLEAVAGYWRGLHVSSNSTNNRIEYLELSDAGSNYVYCCNAIAGILFESGRGSLTNSTISNVDGVGVSTEGGFEFIDFADNRITGCTETPMYMTIEQAGSLDENSDFSGNDTDLIRLYSNDLDDGEVTLVATNIPYGVASGIVIDIKEPLVLDPGVVFEFEANAGLGVTDNGVINAVGTAASNIIFRGTADEVGHWTGIHVETNSSRNVMDYVQIINPGSNYVYCCHEAAGLFVDAGQMTLTNSSISKSAGCGLAYDSDVNMTESNNTYSQNTDGDVCN